MHTSSNIRLPYKSTAAALLMAVILGPVGLLYASIWGGVSLFVLIILLASNHFFFLVLLVWVSSCVWAVHATDQYNRKLHILQNNPGAFSE